GASPVAWPVSRCGGRGRNRCGGRLAHVSATLEGRNDRSSGCDAHEPRRGLLEQSICTPDAFTTSPHRTRTAAVYAAASCGEHPAGSAPPLSSAGTTSGSAQTPLAAAGILSRIGRGVAAGANSPCQAVASCPFSVPPMVGKSGAAALRCGVVTASARTFPAAANGQTVVMLSMARSMLPPSMLLTTSPVLRKGTWVILVLFAS